MTKPINLECSALKFFFRLEVQILWRHLVSAQRLILYPYYSCGFILNYLQNFPTFQKLSPNRYKSPFFPAVCNILRLDELR